MEHKDGPFQPAGNQASVAGAQHGQSSCTKPTAPKGIAGMGCPGGTKRHCPSMHGWRSGTGKPQFSWSWNGEGCEGQKYTPLYVPFSKRKARKNVGPQLKGAGDVLTRLPNEVTSVTSAFSVSSCFFLVNSALTSPQPVSHVAEFGEVKSFPQQRRINPIEHIQVQWIRQAGTKIGGLTEVSVRLLSVILKEVYNDKKEVNIAPSLKKDKEEDPGKVM